MGHKFRYLWQVEARHLLWLIGTVFSVVFVVQYFELPYGDVSSSLFSAGDIPAPGKTSLPSSDSLSKLRTMGNMTTAQGLNSSDVHAMHGIDSNAETMEGNNEGPKNDFASVMNGALDKSFGLDEDNKNVTVEKVNNSGNRSALKNASKHESSLYLENITADSNSSLGKIQEDDMALLSQRSERSGVGLISPFPALPPIISSSNTTSLTNLDPHPITLPPERSSVEEDAAHTLNKDEKAETSQKDLTLSNRSSISIPAVETRPELPAVTTISEMNDLLVQSRASSRSMKPRWSSAVDKELLYAKSQIENAPIIKNDPGLHASLYRNVSVFKRSYELMENTLKVYIYREGERPVFHQPPIKGIYASEGWFMKLMQANKKFVTKNGRKAHLFYLPFSSRMLEEALYVPNSHSRKNLEQYLKNYLDMIGAKYPFWNRTGGADHFLVACHDWAPSETLKLMANSIRALCNSDIREGFKLGKDVSLPETSVRIPQNPLRQLGGKPPSQRRILAFFAGSMHGYVRPILLKYWENKDPDMKIYGRMPKAKKGTMNYIQHMKSSKYCICAKGYEVNSPRVVEAIFYECVPVIISDNFVPPFFEVLNWESFAVFILEKDIPNLKSILLSIPEKSYLEMQMRVKQVQQHFLWHAKPVKYDVFHMILHSVWYNRVLQIRVRPKQLLG